ncbi:regulatory protein RecX [Desulfofarcimen acetoxidans DSM 771]|jgi:regulatory protein|uniref:Regulatory protein RecX n=1 Tax=Desulfofarcimen acetoxidans (strain ATCC 49208 / DSM 771 / KCTC 5769 / VKM B-1644 / 5575) TaxID=485916 RepID=C8W3R8_DESAS|nr:regulatory protein RecX [Desulfofarcimen acetoxidans]ACV63854.1 regulatory protein RecX [Desulfofarcimen acetoxidans DSM 771]
MPGQLEKAKHYALNLLSYRRRSEEEVRNRLRKAEFEAVVIEETMGFLKEYNYINDRDFAGSWVNDRLALKPVGRRRLRWELQQKGVARDIIEQAVNIIDENDEYNMALQLVRKKFSTDINCTSTKIASFLQRRGFSAGVIITICNNIHGKGL